MAQTNSEIDHEPASPKLDAVSFCIWALGSILGRTWRSTIKDPSTTNPTNDFGNGHIYTLWHSSILLAYIFRASRYSVLISNSKDGIRAAAVASKWNLDVVFGSSSHDGFSAFRQCLKKIKESKNIVITPDGPKGPKEKVKTGVAYLAKLTNAPVIPISMIPDRYWRLNSWDKFIIPKPFAKITILIGETVFPENYTKNESDIERLRLKIEENLHAITLA